MHRVVIVGAGFAGLSAARALVGKPVEVTIVDRRNFHTFQPLLYEVATAGLESGDVAYPIRAIFGRAGNVTFRFATATGVDWENRHVTLDDGEPVPFDSLIVASGATAKFFGIPGAGEFSFPLYTLTDARRLRDHVLRQLEQADADPTLVPDGALTFVVVGGGPTGVEVAGALAELLDVAVRHDGFRFKRNAARIIMIDGLDRLLTAFKPAASAYTADTLAGRGVELRLGRMVRSVTSSYVELDQGDRIATRTVVWAGGVTVDGTVASRMGAPTGTNGRLVVDSDLLLVGRSDAYAIGDAAAVPWGPRPGDAGRVCPQLAQVAIQSGAHAAQHIINRIEGRPTKAFHYHDKGIMATIGRRAAITEFPSGVLVKGTLGWLSWLSLHLVYLVGFRNKLIVLVNWSWRYLSWGSGPRVIVDDDLELKEVETGKRPGSALPGSPG
ncbi:MAG: NAD(P)/FAD-dependent oxidoreductase [Acidimicrobiales bacterium]|jgi:NADH dehydrogenase